MESIKVERKGLPHARRMNGSSKTEIKMSKFVAVLTDLQFVPSEHILNSAPQEETVPSNPIRKRSKLGHKRSNGRWEGRFRTQSKIMLREDNFTKPAYKGFNNGVHK